MNLPSPRHAQSGSGPKTSGPASRARFARGVRLALAGLGLVATTASSALAAENYVVLRDVGGVVAADPPLIGKMRNNLLDAYAASGQTLPEVLSVWTSFSMSGNDYGTYIDPRSNDVDGIGLAPKNATAPPLRAILWHNNVLEIPKRSARHRAPVEGYARYLFLLELSHLWGPAINLPAPYAQAAIGFSYHWSFFLDTPGPAGGNAFVDQGNGSYQVVAGDPATVRFSMLDLYLMGLAAAAEVPPFGVLVDPVVPATPSDPFWGGSYAPHSFPWFDQTAAPLVVQANRQEFTVDDVIAENGVRSPAAMEKTSWSIGLVLMVPEDASDEDIAAARTAFEPVANQLAPAFADATQDRGSLEVVTFVADAGAGGAGGGSTSATTGAGAGGGDPTDDDSADSGCQCATPSLETQQQDRGNVFGGLALLGALLSRTRRRRR